MGDGDVEVKFKLSPIWIKNGLLVIGLCILLALWIGQQGLSDRGEETNYRLSEVEKSLADLTEIDYVTLQDLNMEKIDLSIIEGVILSRACGTTKSVIVWERIEGNILGTPKCLPPEPLPEQ